MVIERIFEVQNLVERGCRDLAGNKLSEPGFGADGPRVGCKRPAHERMTQENRSEIGPCCEYGQAEHYIEEREREIRAKDQKGEKPLGRLIESGDDIAADKRQAPFEKTGKEVSGHAQCCGAQAEPIGEAEHDSDTHPHQDAGENAANRLMRAEKGVAVGKEPIAVDRRIPPLFKKLCHERWSKVDRPEEQEQF